MKIVTEVEITSQQIADLMVTAIEGNYMVRSWCEGIYLKGDKPPVYDGPWYSIPATYDNPKLTLELFEFGTNKIHVITLPDIQRGFEVMAKDYAQHFNDIVKENEDAITADVWLQCIVFGKIVYG